MWCLIAEEFSLVIKHIFLSCQGMRPWNSAALRLHSYKGNTFIPFSSFPCSGLQGQQKNTPIILLKPHLLSKGQRGEALMKGAAGTAAASCLICREDEVKGAGQQPQSVLHL